MLEISGMQVFFVLDACFCQSENDDLKDAIIYFYPPQIPESKACSLCGQLFGMAQFFVATFSWPKIVRLSRGKFALKKWGNYLFGLGSSSESSDSKLIDSLAHICKLFCFYHKNIDVYKEESDALGRDFKQAIFKTWTFLLKSVKNESKGSPGTFVLTRPLHLPPILCLESQHLLESCQRNKMFLGGCVLYKNHIVTSQVSPKLTFYMCHYYEDNLTQSTDFPPGISLTKVYVEKSDLNEMLSMNRIPGYLLKAKEQPACFYETSYSDNEDISDADVDSSFDERPFNNGNTNFNKKTSDSKIIPSNKSWSLSTTSIKTADKQKLEPLLNTKGILPTSNSDSAALSSLYSVAEESLKLLNIYNETMKPKRYVRNKKPKIKSLVFRKQDKILPPNIKLVSDDASTDSLLDAKECYGSSPESNFRKEFEFISSWDAESPNYNGKQCPLYVPHDVLPDTSFDNSPWPSGTLYTTNQTTESANKLTAVSKTSKQFKEKKFTGHESFGTSSSETAFDQDVIQLELCSLTCQNTSCLFLLDKAKVAPYSIELTLLNCLELLKKIDAELTELNTASTEVHELQAIHSISCDNLWNTMTGEKLTKSFSVLDDFADHLNMKSLTAQTEFSVKYAHSSMTHKIYSETATQHGFAGIPRSKDTISKVSQLNKIKYDKIGYYLLK